MNSTTKLCLTASCLTLMMSCAAPNNESIEKVAKNASTANFETQELIKINQIGYLVSSEKIAIVPHVSHTEFSLKSTKDNSTVFTGKLSEMMTWDHSGDDQFKQADFTSFTTPGEYYIDVAGVKSSNSFLIGSNDIYSDLHDATLKAYYFNRSSTPIEKKYAGKWHRPAGHPDTNVLVHSSAASESRPEGTSISSPKGWYDAGDYGKYIVNSGISTYTMLTSYQHFSDFYQQVNVNIPESGNSVPDILDEIKWNLDWMATMQDTDGGVYHKLSSLEWPGQEMPEEDTRQRYVIGKSTAPTLNFAAVLALASTIYADYEAQYPGQSAAWLQQAEKAWAWAQKNPNIEYVGDDSGSGPYGDGYLKDEMAWAAAELFLATGKKEYINVFNKLNEAPLTPFWANVSGMAYISLVANGKDLLSNDAYSNVKNKLIGLADSIVKEYNESEYKVAMQAEEYVWGSNGTPANKGFVLMQAYRETGDSKYKDAAMGSLSYLLGRNPTDYSYVTGFGHKTPMGIHHRPSDADGIVDPVPGFLAGGPHDGRQDDCTYPSHDRAKNYLDDWCSYSTNEIAINWNAPLLYLTAAFLNAGE